MFVFVLVVSDGKKGRTEANLGVENNNLAHYLQGCIKAKIWRAFQVLCKQKKLI